MLNNILYGVVVIVLFLASILFGKMEDLKAQLAAQTAQITSLQTQSAAAQSAAQQAHSQADAAINQVNNNSQAIMKQQVSPDCAAAMQYLIDKAKVINK